MFCLRLSYYYSSLRFCFVLFLLGVSIILYCNFPQRRLLCPGRACMFCNGKVWFHTMNDNGAKKSILLVSKSPRQNGCRDWTHNLESWRDILQWRHISDIASHISDNLTCSTSYSANSKENIKALDIYKCDNNTLPLFFYCPMYYWFPKLA